MSRTITALFDTRADAEAGKERLMAADLDADHVHIHDNASAGGTDRGYSTHQDVGMWASIKNAFLPDEDRHSYEEGVRRGGFLLTADVDEDEADEAVRALEDANGVDIDERTSQWKSEGWNYPAASGLAASSYRDNNRDIGDRDTLGGDMADRDTTDRGMTDRTGDDRPALSGMNRDTGDEQHLDVVEEQLVVGKREVDRGGVRVRSYVTEKPVHEQIRLRDENISVDRHPVDRAVTDGDDAFRERSFELTETNEEAVVSKTQRVVEEVVVNKTADERVEEIDDTVRRTDVDVEQLDTDRSTDRTGMTGTTRMTGRDSTDTDDTSFGDKAAGVGKEALGNIKQGLGGMTGNDGLKQSGAAQERAGEQQQGKTPDRS